MQKLKNKKLIIIFLALVIAVIGFVVYKQSLNNLGGDQITPITRPTPNVNYTITFRGLKAGESTKNDVEEQFGSPTGNDGDTYNYNSGYPNDPNQVVYKDGIAVYIKEIVSLQEKRQIAEAENLYGKPEEILYNENSSSGAVLHAYPSQGYAFIGNPNTGTIYEAWFFEPTSDKEFLSTWAEGYSDTETFGYY